MLSVINGDRSGAALKSMPGCRYKERMYGGSAISDV